MSEASIEQLEGEVMVLREHVVTREVELADLRLELAEFEARYQVRVGRELLRLLEVEAQIAERIAQRRPDDEAARRHAAQLGVNARGAEHALREARRRSTITPGVELRHLYRQACRTVHPDLATDGSDHTSRKGLMRDAASAYQSGDAHRLRLIIETASDHETDVALTGGQLTRLVQRLEHRIDDLDGEIAELVISAQHVLMRRIDESGDDLLAAMAAAAARQAQDARRRLDELG